MQVPLSYIPDKKNICLAPINQSDLSINALREVLVAKSNVLDHKLYSKITKIEVKQQSSKSSSWVYTETKVHIGYNFDFSKMFKKSRIVYLIDVTRRFKIGAIMQDVVRSLDL